MLYDQHVVKGSASMLHLLLQSAVICIFMTHY